MIINPLTTVSYAPATAKLEMAGDNQGKAPTTDYNMFLKLLIAQLRNQDPTAPSDPTKYVSQLASFSAVQEATKTNKKLDTLYASNLTNEAASFIGKHVKSVDGKAEGDIKSIRIFSDGVIATLTNGKEVVLGPGVIISDSKDKSDPDKKNDDSDKHKDHKDIPIVQSNLVNNVASILKMLNKSA